MKYAKLGRSGLVVSRLSLGSMTFGATQGASNSKQVLSSVDQHLADELVGASLDAGINLFNTADVYAAGEAETMLGRALGSRRNDVIVATKIGNRLGPALLQTGLSRRYIILAVEDSLRRLNTEWIDVLCCHRYDSHTPLDETLAALDHLVTTGKVRYLGFSNWPAWRAAQAVERQYASNLSVFCATEVYYSLVGRDAEVDLLPFCQSGDIGAMIWSPLAGGLLSGKYATQSQHPNSTSAEDRLNRFDVIPLDAEYGRNVVSEVIAVARELGVAAAQVAIAWLLRQPVATVIVGATRREQLKQNIDALDVHLTEEQLGRLERVSARPLPYPHWCDRLLRDPKIETALGS